MDAPLPQWAEQYVGIPYLTHGRDRAGADCWGLIEMIQAEQLGALWPKYEGADWFKGQKPMLIGRDAVLHAAKFNPVTMEEAKLGDGILIRMRGYPFHVGLVLAPGWMIHTLEGVGSCIEDYRSMLWRDRLTGFYRYDA
ncbi:Endopeptidase, NLPC/P60 domain containing protein [uncultured Caudovirales phage]|uniref:Endopeptidase, NLPC/P60 domain containing protein n=1 Tax=uncultured Caudovirales phage TaxID=2100421 RepID=A0A6J5LAZ3_9CAUD|nr:Endopeptidase, NLPC/P60 domain containing protein [uncultured Caudovirales phage]